MIDRIVEVIGNILINLMIVAILFGVFLQLLPNANCLESHTVKALYIEAEKTIEGRSYYLPRGSNPEGALNLGLDVDLLDEIMFFNTKVVSLHDRNQFRMIGLDFELGTRFTRHIDIYYRHFSGHALDAEFDRKFPFDDSIGIRFNLIKGD